MLTRRTLLKYLSGTGVLGICGVHPLGASAFDVQASSPHQSCEDQRSVMDALRLQLRALNRFQLHATTAKTASPLRACIEECRALCTTALSVAQNQQLQASAILQASADSCRRLSLQAERCLADSAQMSDSRAVNAIVDSSRRCESVCIRAVQA